MHSVRHWISFFVGVLIFIFGLFPLIGKDAWLLNVTTTIPGIVFAYVVALGGIYVIFDSFFEYTFHSSIFIASFLVGLVVFGVGLTTVLKSMGVIAFGFDNIPLIIYQILFMIEGLFLMLGCFVMD